MDFMNIILIVSVICMICKSGVETLVPVDSTTAGICIDRHYDGVEHHRKYFSKDVKKIMLEEFINKYR